ASVAGPGRSTSRCERARDSVGAILRYHMIPNCAFAGGWGMRFFGLTCVRNPRVPGRPAALLLRDGLFQEDDGRPRGDPVDVDEVRHRLVLRLLHVEAVHRAHVDALLATDAL